MALASVRAKTIGLGTARAFVFGFWCPFYSHERARQGTVSAQVRGTKGRYDFAKERKTKDWLTCLISFLFLYGAKGFSFYAFPQNRV